MRNSKLIELLKTFNSEELKSFHKYLESPFLKPDRKVLVFFNYLKKYSPDYDSDDLDKENVFKKLFPGEQYNERSLVNRMFDLTKSAEKFLAYNSLLKNDPEFLLNLSKAYLDKKLPKHSERVNRSMDKILVKGFSISKDYISKFRRLTQLKNACYMEFNDSEGIIESQLEYFNASAIQFVMDYIEILGSKKPAKYNYGKNFDNPVIEAITESFDIDKFLESIKGEDTKTPYISISYYLLKMLREPEETEHYNNLRDLFYKDLSNDESLLDREEKSAVFTYLTNYCTQRYNLKFMEELLSVYKKMLEHNVYSETENGYMQMIVYRNVVKVCISLKETEWFEDFIKKYSDKLSPEFRKDMENLSYSHLHFLKKEFEKSLSKIKNVSENLEFNKTDIRNLKLRLFFELNHIEEAFALVNSYKQYLSKTADTSNENKEYFNNFIKYYLQLLKIKSEDSSEDPSYIKSKIEKETRIILKKWLMEKADELANR